MKEIIPKTVNIAKIEFWAATTIYVFAVFFLVSKVAGIDHHYVRLPNEYLFKENDLEFSYFSNYFFPQLCRYTIFYCSFLLLNFYITPLIIKKQSLITNIILIIFIFFILGFTFGITDTWLKAYTFTAYKSDQATYDVLFKASFTYAFWLMMMFSFYTVTKYFSQYLLAHSDAIQLKYQAITRDGIIAFVLWMISMFLLMIGNSPKGIIGIWAVIIPFGIGLYWYSFSALIPQALRKRKPFIWYLGLVLGITVVSVLAVSFIMVIIYNKGEIVAVINMFNIAFQLLITAPISWQVYKHRQANSAEIYVLKSALGRSDARLDLLRSQINPHFLFNALNTLYGTSIQENAERTGEGIQKLGDMMRFMLQENTQDQISLNREVEYLTNYIALQKLRTESSADIVIQTEIEPQVNALQIAPMLLIPFVENAFKHGISLREPSHIKITLQTVNNMVYFDVYNSIHSKSDTDPESDKSGIGLENVKQRLALLYPNRHELVIRETLKEFFIHLTIHLA